jgi:ATP-binding cassette subfamily B protein
MSGTTGGTRAKLQWRRVGSLFAPYVLPEAGALGCMLVSCVLGLAPPLLTARIIDSAIPHRDVGELGRDIGIMFAATLVAALASIGYSYLNSVVGEAIMRDLRTKLGAHLHRLPISFFVTTHSGEVLNRISNDVDGVNDVVTTTLTSVVTNVVGIATALGAMLYLNWRLTLLTIPIVLLMIAPIGPVGQRLYGVRKQSRETRDELESIMQETISLSGIVLMKSFVREGFERGRLHDAGTRLMRLQVNLKTTGQWFAVALGVLSVLGPAAVWFFGGRLAIAHQLDSGIIVAFVALIGTRLYAPAAALVGMQVALVSAAAIFERLFGYLDLAPETYAPAGAIELGQARGKIEFSGVSFTYEGAAGELDGVAPRTLRELDFTIEPGQIAAFVGPSGAGKSTIAHLVERFYVPQAGCVKIDDVDSACITLESLRRNIGIVSQETYLFHDTIAANLRYAKPAASDLELQQAARAANIHDFISRLPAGYQTVVGQRGHKLSGGERQRLAIARVLLQDPRIVILDEATSSLDALNEAEVQAAMAIAMKGRTTLVIAHRLATIVRADVIFVIDHGRVTESGTHDQLLARRGTYASLYNRQFGVSLV